MLPQPQRPTLFPYTTLFRSQDIRAEMVTSVASQKQDEVAQMDSKNAQDQQRSEEHTSELQSRFDLVCLHLLAKKKRPSTESTPTQYVYLYPNYQRSARHPNH